MGLRKCSQQSSSRAVVDNVENDKLQTIIIEHLFRLIPCVGTEEGNGVARRERSLFDRIVMTCIDLEKH